MFFLCCRPIPIHPATTKCVPLVAEADASLEDATDRGHKAVRPVGALRCPLPPARPVRNTRAVARDVRACVLVCARPVLASVCPPCSSTKLDAGGEGRHLCSPRGEDEAPRRAFAPLAATVRGGIAAWRGPHEETPGTNHDARGCAGRPRRGPPAGRRVAGRHAPRRRGRAAGEGTGARV